jgi:putative ATPase
MESIAHRSVGSCQVWVIQGDLTQQPVSALVNAANEQLSHGGGVAVALVRTGGRVIQEESDAWVREHGPLPSGTAAVTTAGMLQASHIIHVVGPRYRSGRDDAAQLTAAITAALDAAIEVEARSVAIPAVSAGIFGYPLDSATATIAAAVVEWCESHQEALDEIRLVGFDAKTARAFAVGLAAA